MPARTVPATSTRVGAPSRVTIRDPRPSLDGGRYPVKRCVGDTLAVTVEAFADGHDVLRAVVKAKPPGRRKWVEYPMRHVDAEVDGDTWAGEFAVDCVGPWTWTVEAWIDHFLSWRREVRRKLDAAQDDLSGELAEGALLLKEAAGRAKGADKKLLAATAALLEDPSADPRDRTLAALEPAVADAAANCPDRAGSCMLDEQPLWVDRERARFGSWYELFPRSWGGLQGTAEVVPELAALGFDVLYLTPVHPIGVTKRKGRNNSLVAEPGDVGSPWAIGGREGGHEALHPDLGTFEDFDALVATCAAHEMEVAIDLAFQCSADHPWLTEHPGWFQHRPDGTLKYAENPPKKYQDIYNFDWTCKDWKGLWNALLDVVLHWVSHGVAIFRVDNPHTKPLAFWEWMIAKVHERHPEVVFLAEAFTRRAMMRALAKVGFSQSYTYFTWKNARWELVEYLTELTTETQDYFRPNFFANTPDILHEYLQHGGRPAFEARLVLAATLSPSYGIYSGYEHFEHVAVRPGSEEYLDSEKYEMKHRALDGPLLPMVGTVNHARRRHAALRRLTGLRFLDTANEALVAYAKQDGWDTVLCAVNLDPYHAQEGLIDVPHALGVPPAFTVRDELTGEHYHWHVGGNYVRLDPGKSHLMAVIG